MAKKTVAEIQDIAKQIKTKRIVIYPWVHLSEEPSSPRFALELLLLGIPPRKREFRQSKAAGSQELILDGVQAFGAGVAAHLLTGTDRPVRDISIRTGFHDSSHLNRHFLAHHGLTPRSFRKATARPAA